MVLVSAKPTRLLLDSRVVEVPMVSNATFVMLSSLLVSHKFSVQTED
jgi:hypothetical protein